MSRSSSSLTRANSSCLALRRRTSGLSGGIEHPAFAACDTFHRARLRSPLLEFSLAHKENVHWHGEASERTIKLHEFLVTVRYVFFDDQQTHVAPRIGFATGPRPKQDDALRMDCRHESLDGGLNP